MQKVSLREITENKQEIRDISLITQSVLKERGIIINNAEILPTIVFDYIRAAAKYTKELATSTGSNNVTINFADLFEIGVNDRVTEEGEKGMNVVPVLIPGTEMQIVVKDDYEEE